MEVIGEVYIHEMEVLHDSCRMLEVYAKTGACESMHVSNHVTIKVVVRGWPTEPSARLHASHSAKWQAQD
jgi:hypothetical protein